MPKFEISFYVQRFVRNSKHGYSVMFSVYKLSCGFINLSGIYNHVKRIANMPGDTCVVCGNTRASDPGVSFHRFPSNSEKRAVWLRSIPFYKEATTLTLV